MEILPNGGEEGRRNSRANAFFLTRHIELHECIVTGIGDASDGGRDTRS
jgi:hypothetical protein